MNIVYNFDKCSSDDEEGDRTNIFDDMKRSMTILKNLIHQFEINPDFVIPSKNDTWWSKSALKLKNVLLLSVAETKKNSK